MLGSGQASGLDLRGLPILRFCWKVSAEFSFSGNLLEFYFAGIFLFAFKLFILSEAFVAYSCSESSTDYVSVSLTLFHILLTAL